jgi:hypothetical protein
VRRYVAARTALAVSLFLITPRLAHAVEIRDGSEFSIALPQGAQACLLYPKALFDSRACPPGSKPADREAFDGNTRTVAAGSIRVRDGDPVAFMVVRYPIEHMTRPSDLEGVRRELVHGVRDSRPGAHVLGEVDVHFADVGGQSVARGSFNADGYVENGLTHEVLYEAWDEEGMYMVSWIGPLSHGPAIDALADETAATLRIAHPAPVKPGRDAAYAVGYVLGRVLAALLLFALLGWAWGRSRAPR